MVTHGDANAFMQGMDRNQDELGLADAQPVRNTDGTVQEANDTLIRQNAQAALDAAQNQIAQVKSQQGLNEFSVEAGRGNVPQDLQRLEDQARELESHLSATTPGQPNPQLAASASQISSTTQAVGSVPADSATRNETPADKQASEDRAAAAGAIFGGALMQDAMSAEGAAPAANAGIFGAAAAAAAAASQEMPQEAQQAAATTPMNIFGAVEARPAEVVATPALAAVAGGAAGGDEDSVSQQLAVADSAARSMQFARADAALVPDRPPVPASLAGREDVISKADEIRNGGLSHYQGAQMASVSPEELGNLQPLPTPGGIDRGIGMDSASMGRA